MIMTFQCNIECGDSPPMSITKKNGTSLWELDKWEMKVTWDVSNINLIYVNFILLK